MRIIRWFWHWGLQGLKLTLFATVAAVAASVICSPGYRLWQTYLADVEKFSAPEHWSHIPVMAVCALLWLPVFGAAFAALLENYPVPPIVPLWEGLRNDVESDDSASQHE